MMTLGALYGARHINVYLTLSSDNDSVDFDPRDIQGNRYLFFSHFTPHSQVNIHLASTHNNYLLILDF